jgi:hypothetical protein
MTSLTRIAVAARKTIRYGIYAVLFLIVGKFVLDISTGIYRSIFPPGPPPATVKFGKLPSIRFPQNQEPVEFNFVLETPEGGLLQFPTQANVYFMPKVNPNLLSLDLAREKARALNFTSDPEQITTSVYRFRNPNLPTVMEINIVTGSFSISYDLNSDRSPIETRPPLAEVAATDFRGILSGANILPNDLTGPTTHSFFKLSEGRLASALSLSESDVVKVNLFRKAYNDLPSLPANPNEANVWAIMSGSPNRQQRLIASEYHYLQIDEAQFSTYPIKTSQEAYAELTGGFAFIADAGTNREGGNVVIRRVYLAYFDPEEPSDFYQPIYAFEGDNGFTAYVPAVTRDYYGE